MGVDRTHLWRVIRGIRTNPALLERYLQLAPGGVPYKPNKTEPLDQVRHPDLSTSEDAVRTLMDAACSELSRAVHRRQLYQSLQSDFYGLRSLAVAIDQQMPRVAAAFSVPQVHEGIRSVAEDHDRGLRMMLMNAAEILRLVNPTCAASLDIQIQEDGGAPTAELALQFLRRELQKLCEPPPNAAKRTKATRPQKPSKVPKDQ